MLSFLQSAFASATGALGPQGASGSATVGVKAAALAAGHRMGLDSAVWLRGGWLRLRAYGATEASAAQHLYVSTASRAAARAPGAAAALRRFRSSTTANALRLRTVASAQFTLQWHSAAKLLAGPMQTWNAAVSGRLRV